MGLPACGIPEDTLPLCWSDDIRMNALFAPFRLKSTNLESWDMKMKFWSEMLRQWCKYRKDPIVSASDAKVAFQRKGRTSACLDIVVEEMFRCGELCPVSKYQHILHNGPEGWVKWGARLAFKPAAFAITAMTSLLPARQTVDSDGLPKASIDSTQRFVLESAVKEQATEFLENYPVDVERIGTVDEIMKNYKFQQSREIFEILLGWLVSQGLAVKKNDIVKLGDIDKKVTAVTQADEALVKLVSAEKQLEGDTVRGARDLASAEADARAALQLGNRIAAKNHLRRKHKINQRLERSISALENVRQLIQQMKDQHVNVAIVDTYRTSSEAMKQGMKESGLEEDAVLDTMEDLKEVMDSYNEVEKALGGTVDDYDAAELEEELKELLAGPGKPEGGTPGKEKKTEAPTLGPKATPGRKVSERDFIFDGEARMLAELNELDIDDSSPEEKNDRKEEKKKVALTDNWERDEKPKEVKNHKPSKSWYPPTKECLRSKTTWSNDNPDVLLENLSRQYGEVRQDERLHPGQELNVDFTKPPKHYSTDFQVRDHRPAAAGFWLFNSKDGNPGRDDLAQSTEYFSSESPGKTGGSFQMAPGGERHTPNQWPNGEPAVEESSVEEEIERRLKNLRGLNL